MSRSGGGTLVRGEVNLLPFVTLLPAPEDDWIGQREHVQLLWRALLDYDEGRIQEPDMREDPSAH